MYKINLIKLSRTYSFLVLEQKQNMSPQIQFLLFYLKGLIKANVPKFNKHK